MKYPMLPRLRFSFAAVVLLLCTMSAFADDDAPQWLKTAAAQSIPTYEAPAEAVYLLSEQRVSLDPRGMLSTTTNEAIKILDREGLDMAVARVMYLVNSGKVRELRAWLIRSDGTVKAYGKESVVDVIANQEDVYNEGRMKLIDASGDADVGHVFGYTATSEEQPLFYQDSWRFQQRLPTLVSRYTLELPAGWKASSVTFNAPQIAPQTNGTIYTWEMRSLAAIKSEPMSPGIANLSPRIAINYAPETGSQGVNRAFANWLDVSRWATPIFEPEMIVDDSIAIKARELTANAKTEFEKITAIGAYAQNIQYISIDIGVGRGNGFRPRPSNLVLKRGYGDCKDKANLMRALLKAINIETYPIAIFAGDPTYVRAEWASPQQFNHCIVAVKISDQTKSGAVLEHPKLGRLLIFDATNPYTPVGDLTDSLQGSNGLIIAGENGGLVAMPVAPPDADVLDRRIEASLDVTGAITGKISERAIGQTSSEYRRDLRSLSSVEYKKELEGWLARGASGAQLVSFNPKDRLSENGFDLDLEFSIPRYGQLMQKRLLIFKPVIVSRRNRTPLSGGSRSTPVEIDSGSLRETVTVKLPVGFAVDELPEPVNLKTRFGTYSTKYEASEDQLVFSRTMQTTRAVIPPEGFAEVRDFFAAMRSAEQAPVVLIKK